MKKILILFVALATVFTSCSKDSDKDNQSYNNDLGGTEWKFDSPNKTLTLTFLDDTRVKQHSVVLGLSFTYQYNYTFDEKQGSGVLLKFSDQQNVPFTIKGNRLTVKTDKYYKQ